MHDPIKVTRIQPHGQDSQASAIDPTRIIAGNPRQMMQNGFTNQRENFSCGIWSSTSGKWHVHYQEDEFCYLITGEVILTDATGHSETLHGGDAFVIPAGFEGTWETVEDAQKFYAVYEESPQAGN